MCNPHPLSGREYACLALGNKVPRRLGGSRVTHGWQCRHNDHSPGKARGRGSGDVDLSSSARERQQVKPHHPINIRLQ